MRWLLDQGLPRTAAVLLRASCQDAIHVGDIGLSSAADAEILRLATVQDRVVVTLDADFHAMLAASTSSKPSVIRIRKEGCKAPEVARLILAAAERFKTELESGCVMTVLGSKIRLRNLPLI